MGVFFIFEILLDLSPQFFFDLNLVFEFYGRLVDFVLLLLNLFVLFSDGSLKS